LNQQHSENHNQIKKKVTGYEKFEIQIGLSQLNRGERISLEEFLKMVSGKSK